MQIRLSGWPEHSEPWIRQGTALPPAVYGGDALAEPAGLQLQPVHLCFSITVMVHRADGGSGFLTAMRESFRILATDPRSIWSLHP